MKIRRFRDVFGPALLAAMAYGCNTAEPGAGFTNGPPPEIAPEKPGVRDDLPPPDRPDKDVLAGQDATNLGGTVAGGTSPGADDKGGSSGGTSPATPKADTSVPAAPPKN
jgi:hypothetical protein